jgi:hypothetical protein
MAFRYKTPRKEHKPAPFFNAQVEVKGEGLTGLVQGMKASDLEERFARAMAKDNRVMGYTFRQAVIAPRNMPGQLEVDFVVQVGPIIRPIQIDGDFTHKGDNKKQSDKVKDILVDNYFHKFGYQPVQRINGNFLSTQKDADRLVREVL